MKSNKIIYKYLLSGLFCSMITMPVLAQSDDDDAVQDSTATEVEAVKAITVTGKVLSAADGKPLQNIGVRIQGESGSTETAADGTFTIGATQMNAYLELTYPGYRTTTIFLNGRTNLTVHLEPTDHPSNLDVIKLTTGDFEKRYVAQASSTINEDKLQYRAITSPEYYMQGELAGVNVTAFNGAPGAGADIVLRAKNSIYGGSKPLYIVDGMEISQFDISVSDGSIISPLIAISPNDIEHITFLKDAAAKAIYGSRGANGVIVIETFKGKKGSSQIDFTATLGSSDLRKSTLPMMTGDEHRQYMLEMGLSQYDGNLGDLINNFGTALFNDPSNKDVYQKYNNNTDWIKETQQKGFYQDYHFRMRGGDDVAKYAFAVGYLDNKGIIVGTGMNRLSARFNLDYNITDKLLFGSSLAFAQINMDQTHQVNSQYNPLLLSMKKSPITTPYIQDIYGNNTPVLEDQDVFGLYNLVGDGSTGEFNGLNNPKAITNGAYSNEYLSNAISGRVFLNYTHKDLDFNLSVGLDNRTEQTNIFIPERGFATDVDRYRTSVQGYFDNLLVDAQFSVAYAKRFNYVHDFSAKAGLQYMDNNLKYRYGRAYNNGNDNFTLVGQGTLDSISSRSDIWRLFGAYATANYVYYDRYILNGTVRVDGSSRFGAKTKAAVFPAIAAAWRIDQENFLKDNAVINEWKLRASYGLSGNDNIGNYYAKLLYQPANYKELGGFAIKNLANEKLKPEINRELEVGMDFGLLSNKIALTVDYFNTVNSNMIVYNNVKQVSGMQGAYMNVGENTNQGLEAGLNFHFQTGAVKYDIGGTFALVKSEVTKMPSATPYIENTYGIFTARAQEGYALGSYYGFQTEGVYKDAQDLISPYTGKPIVNGKSEYNQNTYAPFEAGDVKFVDQNKDGVINDKDKVFLGDPNPDFFGSVRGQIRYKGLSVSALVDYQIGRDIVNGLRYQLESQSDYANQTVAVNRRWKQAGDVTDMPRLSYGDPTGNNRFSDRWIEDGSFLRLRNVTISYDLPESWVKKAYLQKVTIFVTGENLLTWTKYTGLDPEFNSLNDGLLYGVDAGSMPVSRSYSAGIRIGL